MDRLDGTARERREWDGKWTEETGRTYEHFWATLRGFRSQRRPSTSLEWLRNTPPQPLVQSHLAPLSAPQRFGVVLISTLRLALTMWNGISKVHYEQLRLRRTGRQISKIQFLCIRIGTKQLIVVNMLSCSGVPSGDLRIKAQLQ